MRCAVQIAHIVGAAKWRNYHTGQYAQSGLLQCQPGPIKGADVNQYLIQNPLTYYGTSSCYHQPHEATYKCKPAFVDDRRTSEHFDKSVLLDG